MDIESSSRIIRHGECADEDDDEEEKENEAQTRHEQMIGRYRYDKCIFRQDKSNYQRRMSSSSKPPLCNILSATFKPIYLIILIQLFIISSAPIISHCDQPDGRNFVSRHWHDDYQYHHYRSRRSEAANLRRTSRSSIVGERQGGEEKIKAAALATKLNQWLKCYRTNFLLTQQQQRLAADQRALSEGHQDTTTENQPLRTNGDKQTPAEPLPVTCRASFDGHLCWPQTQAGQQIRLPCPQINFLSSRTEDEVNSTLSTGNPLTTTTTTNHQQQPLKSVIATIQRQQDSLNGGDINQTHEITSANIQSIKPTGSRAGITTTAMINQPNQMTDGLSYDERGIVRAVGSTSLDSNEKHGTDAKLIAGFTQHPRYARRSCDRPSQPNNDEKLGQWQNNADYSDCKQANPTNNNNNLFDPTDEWVALNDDDGQDFSSKDRELFKNLSEQLERIEPSIDPYSEPDLLEQWILCIGEVLRRSTAGEESRTSNSGNNSTGYCPIIFDGWRCWPATKAGEIAYVNCPKNQPGFSAERKAYKICTLQADWYRHPETNRYWSNYTTCVDTVDLAFRTKILNLYVIGNLISLIALAVSLIIFVSFKNLNCTRVTIHKNLFLSFITNNLMWIIWYTYVVNDATLLQKNPIECRLWHILLHYFLVSNYFWMFCEGLYLHTLLVVTFISEDRIIKWFYLLGWLTPVPIILTYAYHRSYDEYYTNFCWMEESPHNVILMAPIGFSLLLNLIFLINIVRVLVTKLRANNSPDTHQTRKAVRATLILIPLLGLHYMLTPFRPEAKSEWEVYYEIIAAVCTSFQGLCVAMLFCFCNGEVMNAIKKRLKDSILFKRDSKRTMRSRSNTALSNVFNSVAFTTGNNNGQFDTHHHNNSHNPPPSQRCAAIFETGHINKPLCSSSSNYDNLIASQLQRQPLIANSNKQTPNGHNTSNVSGPSSDQRASVMTTITELSHAEAPYQQSQFQSPGTIIKTKLICQKLPTIRQPMAEEANKLLCPSNETNNNVTANGDGNEASC